MVVVRYRNGAVDCGSYDDLENYKDPYELLLNGSRPLQPQFAGGARSVRAGEHDMPYPYQETQLQGDAGS